MVSKAVIETLKRFVPEENIYLEEPMKEHTTFRLGGPADCFIEIENEQQLAKVQKYLWQLGLPFFILGRGSNLLVGDFGYRGVVLQVASKMAEIHVKGTSITAQAGALLSQVAKTAWEHGLTGFEFASGIPGTIGGGVVMNAGAYGGEMKQVVKSVKVLNKESDILELDNETMEFGYRTSAIRNHPFLVTEVTIELEEGNPVTIRNKMQEFAAARKEKQPLEYPSAGSTFKRPEGYFAGELIMKAGLQGYQVGGARVSEKHCGFVINTGDASASNVLEIIKHIQYQVKEKFRVDLEPEIVIIGEFASKK